MSSAKINAACAHCGLIYRKRADRVRSPDFCGLSCRKEFSANQRAADRGRLCAACGATFIPRAGQLRAGQGRYCSLICGLQPFVRSGHGPGSRAKSVETWHRNGNFVPSGPDNPLFFGRKIAAGYVWVWVDGRGYIQEHRLVVERILGRALTTDEVVHHINERRDDNRPENLKVMTRAAHMDEHRDDIVAARKAAPWRKTA